MIIPITPRKADLYMYQSERDVLYRRIVDKFFKDKNFLAKHLKNFKRDKRRFLSAAKELRNLSRRKINNKDLLEGYRLFVKSYNWFHQYILFPFALDEFIDPDFQAKLYNKLSDRAKEIYKAVTTPTKVFDLERQRNELLKAKINGQLEKIIDKHVEKYGWLDVYDVSDKPRSKQLFLKEVMSIKNPRQFLKKFSEKLKQKRAKYKWALKQLKKYSKLYRTTKLIHEYVWLRTERVDVWRQEMLIVQPFYRLLEKRMKLPFGYAAHLSINEIEDFLFDGVKPDIKFLRLADKHGQMTYYKNKQLRIIRDPQEIKKVAKKELSSIEQVFIKKLVGRSAFPGFVKGTVRIVLKPAEANKMKPGDILVANMTHPDYMMAIKKAKAIITDEGGITCHAAIISRELKIPCVIATKTATKVLKDGGRVEVDADNGIIKKL